MSLSGIMNFIQNILNHRQTSWAILGFSLLIRMGYAAFMGHDLWVGDAAAYIEDALNLQQGIAYGPYWPPGLPLLLAPFAHSWWMVTAVMLSIWMGFYVLLWHLLGKRLERIWVNALLFCFSIYPAFLLHSVAPLTHLPVALAMLGIMWWLEELNAEAQRRGGGDLNTETQRLRDRTNGLARPPAEGAGLREGVLTGALGLTITFMILTRPGSMTVWFLLLSFLIWQCFQNWRKSWLSILLVVLIPITGISLWNQHASKMAERPIFINEANGRNIFIGNNAWTPMYKTWWLGSHDERENPEFQGFYSLRDSIEALPPASESEAWTPIALEHIQAYPGKFILRTLSRISCFFAFDTYAGANLMALIPSCSWLGYLMVLLDALCFFLLCGLGLIGFLRIIRQQGFRLHNLWIPLLILAYAVPYFFAFAHPTYHLPIMALLALMIQPKSQPGNSREWVALGLLALNQILWIGMVY